MGTGVCPDASGTEGKLRHRAPHRKDHTSPSHSSWDLGETPRWPQTHIMLSPPTARRDPRVGGSSQGAGQGLLRVRGLGGPQRPAQAGADTAVPCRATAQAAPGERLSLGSQTRARGLRRLRHRQPAMLCLWLSANTCLRHRLQRSGFTETTLSWGWARAPAVNPTETITASDTGTGREMPASRLP